MGLGIVDAAISRNYFPIRESKHLQALLEGVAWDQTGGTVMRSSGAPENVNTRSIEQFIFSPRDVCALEKMIQARLPRSFN
jgi:hypothetical protein